jgi:hypothetical protein
MHANKLGVPLRLVLLLVFGWLMVTTTGCEMRKPVPKSISGRIEQNGKPVYPVVLMLQDENGKSLTANVKNQNGEFSIFGVELGSRYAVAIEPIQLSGISQADRAEAERRAEQAKAEGRELRREDTLPSQFQNANIDFPKRYTSFADSGLTVDCSTSIPSEPIVFDLK